MITDINKFNELECKQRNDKIAATHDYGQFKAQMHKRLKDQQAAAKRAENHFLPPPQTSQSSQPKAPAALEQLALVIKKTGSGPLAKKQEKASQELKRKASVSTARLAQYSEFFVVKRQKGKDRVNYYDQPRDYHGKFTK